MKVVTAFLQVLGQRRLHRDRPRQARHQLQPLDLARQPAGRGPADAVARRQTLRERRAVQHQPAAVVGLRRQRRRLTLVELRIDVVFDQRHVVAGEQIDEVALLRLGHQAAERVLEGRHQPAGLRAVEFDHLRQAAKIDALAHMGRHLDGAQAQALQGLQRHVESGRLDHHRITRLRRRVQAQVQRLHRTVGQHDFVGGHGHALTQIALGNLALQPQVARRQVLDHAPGFEPPGTRDQRAAQSVEWKQERARERRTEGHDVASARCAKTRVDQVADVYSLGSGLRRRGLRLREQHALGARGDEVARPWRGTDQATRFEQVVGLEDRTRAQVPAGTSLTYGRQAIPRAQNPRSDLVLEFSSQQFVPRGDGCRAITHGVATSLGRLLAGWDGVPAVYGLHAAMQASASAA